MSSIYKEDEARSQHVGNFNSSGVEIKMDIAKDFQYLEIVIRHCQSAYKISCTNAAFEKAKQLNFIDQKGCFSITGRDLALLMEHDPHIYQNAQDKINRRLASNDPQTNHQPY